ncbi:MAG TPA: DUF6573 family protein [Thermodesulfobacteriota bacterium]|jgi:hypothetical protein|nr:DUF6573 family protein [Thermodesulfobacteriota bacterium]
MSREKSTRKEALEKGRQRDISDAAKNAGLPLRVFITDAVWNSWITPDQVSKDLGQNENSRLNSVLDKLRYAIRVQRQTGKSNDTLYFDVALSRSGQSEMVTLISRLSVTDFDDPRPCITIMMPEE